MLTKTRKKLFEKNSNLQASSPVTIAFFGDSVTHGCFELCAGPNGGFRTVMDYEAVYHAKLKKMINHILPVAPVNIINAGIGGANAQRTLLRLKRDVLVYSPDLVVICFGLNDALSGLSSLDSYTSALKEMFQRFKAEGIEIIFMTPNMMNTYVSPKTYPEGALELANRTAETQNSGVMDAYMEAARKLCMEEEVPVCDCYSKWRKMYDAGVDTTELLSNYLNHPTREMHTMFAVSLLEMILLEK